VYKTLLKDLANQKATTREPWQMTQKEYLEYGTKLYNQLGNREYVNTLFSRYSSDAPFEIHKKASRMAGCLGLPASKREHLIVVLRALSEGKPVSPEVLKDYPDLRVKKEVTVAKKKLTRDDVEIHKWFERDRQHIEVRNKKTQETVAEWWDEAVTQMVEDGFFYSPGLGWRVPAEQRKLDESVLKYLEDTGVLESGKRISLRWHEMPSVTTGGKPTFFVADTPWGKRWVVWDRVERKWSVTGEQQPPKGESPVYGYFNSAGEGKQFVEEGKAVLKTNWCPVCGGDLDATGVCSNLPHKINGKAVSGIGLKGELRGKPLADWILIFMRERPDSAFSVNTIQSAIYKVGYRVPATEDIKTTVELLVSEGLVSKPSQSLYRYVVK
jgi:hypothetical protein